MAQYHIPGKEPRYHLIVGWDADLGSFFAQVEDWAWETDGRVVDEEASIGDSPDEGLVVWVGVGDPILDVQELIDAVAPYGTIPEDVQERIRQDQRAPIRPRQVDSELDLFYEYQQVTEAQELFVARRYDEALAILEKVLVNNPQAVVAVAMKAGIELGIGQLVGAQKEEHTGRAIELYEQAIALAYEQGYAQITPRLRVGLGLAHADAGHIEEALAHYDEALHALALDVAPEEHDEALAWEAKGDLFLFRKHDPTGALPFYERAAQLRPDNEVIQYNLGLARWEQRQQRKASGR